MIEKTSSTGYPIEVVESKMLDKGIVNVRTKVSTVEVNTVTLPKVDGEDVIYIACLATTYTPGKSCIDAYVTSNALNQYLDNINRLLKKSSSVVSDVKIEQGRTK